MGAHEAYHRNPLNRVFHWICIPLELAAVIKLLSLVPVGPVDLAWVIIVATAPVYLLAEPLIGAVMVAFLMGCARSASLLAPDAPLFGALLAAVTFALTFSAQVLIGHRIFEEGRDDTEKNLAELRRTKNPIPILLVFYYHLVELFLAVGYRPQLKRDIAIFTERELASWER
jgi:uncharacterized membrane protein YGL010W